MRHCDTDNIIGNFFTKRLQVVNFRTFSTFSTKVMNCPVSIYPEYMRVLDTTSVPATGTATGVC